MAYQLMIDGTDGLWGDPDPAPASRRARGILWLWEKMTLPFESVLVGEAVAFGVAVSELSAARDEVAELRAKVKELEAAGVPSARRPATAPVLAAASASSRRTTRTGATAGGAPAESEADILDVFGHFLYNCVPEWRKAWEKEEGREIKTSGGCGAAPTAAQKRVIATALGEAQDVDKLCGWMDKANFAALPRNGNSRGDIGLWLWLQRPPRAGSQRGAR